MPDSSESAKTGLAPGIALEDVVGALDSLRVGVAVWDQADTLIYCNEQFRYFYRTIQSLTDILGRRYEDLLRLIVDNGEIAGREVLEDPEAWIGVRLAHHRSGTWRPFLERLTNGRWIEVKERPGPGGIKIGLWSDVTDQMRSQLQLDGAIDALAEGFALWDQADRLVRANGGFFAIHSVNEGPLVAVGERYRTLLDRAVACGIYCPFPLPEGPAPGDPGWLQDRLADRRKAASQYVLFLSDGRWVLVQNRRTADGGVASIYTDISDVKRAEHYAVLRGQTMERTIGELEMTQAVLEDQGREVAALAEDLDRANRELQEANQAKLDFLRTLSHELRTPLNAIIGFSGLLATADDPALSAAEVSDYGRTIRQSSEHLLNMVNQLLGFARVEAGRYTLQLDWMRPDHLVRDVVRMMRTGATEKQQILTADLADNFGKIRLDETALRQIFINLVGNAEKYTPTGGRITVTGHPTATGAVFTVADSGPGIDPEDLPRLLQPFERGATSAASHPEGIGLGLALTQSLVNLLNGTLTVESAPGAGTRITVWLPYDPEDRRRG